MFSLSSLFHAPPTDAITPLYEINDLIKLILAFLVGGLVRLLWQRWLVKPLEKSEAHEETELRIMQSDIKELKEWKNSTGNKIMQLEVETKAGFLRLEEKVRDQNETSRRIEDTVSNVKDLLNQLIGMVENAPKGRAGK